jgi:parallel beta-helix repeat protein
VTANVVGIEIDSSSNNTVNDNYVAANSRYGILLSDSSGNIIYHNSFVGNAVQAFVSYVYPSEPTNTWDDGYPSGGNFWSDYNGTDLYSGPYQNVTGSDGIGDTPYVIVSLDTTTYLTSNTTDIDHFPLMGSFSDFSVAAGVDVQVVSNSTVSDFQFNGTAILFNVSGASGTTGFCNVRVPTALLNGTLSVFVNGTQVKYSLLPVSNSSISYLYFTYGQSTEQVIIMPEFPEPLILAMFMLATLMTVAIYKKRQSRSQHALSVCVCVRALSLDSMINFCPLEYCSRLF